MITRKKRKRKRRKSYRKRAATNTKRGACFVYVMQRTTNVSFYARATFQNEYKIGIAKDWKKRNREVDGDIKGDVIVLSSRWIRNGYQVEQYLHKLFGDSRF